MQYSTTSSSSTQATHAASFYLPVPSLENHRCFCAAAFASFFVLLDLRHGCDCEVIHESFLLAGDWLVSGLPSVMRELVLDYLVRDLYFVRNPGKRTLRQAPCRRSSLRMPPTHTALPTCPADAPHRLCLRRAPPTPPADIFPPLCSARLACDFFFRRSLRRTPPALFLDARRFTNLLSPACGWRRSAASLGSPSCPCSASWRSGFWREQRADIFIFWF